MKVVGSHGAWEIFPTWSIRGTTVRTLGDLHHLRVILAHNRRQGPCCGKVILLTSGWVIVFAVDHEL